VAAKEGGLKVVKAPMPCKILKVLKNFGDEVKKGEVLMVVESMKMEMSINAPEDGVFGTIRAEGEAVEEASVLCEVN
jgi:biotin carboxyl carrier protein